MDDLKNLVLLKGLMRDIEGKVLGSDAAGYDLSRLKPESSWVLIQAEPRLAESILPASTST